MLKFCGHDLFCYGAPHDILAQIDICSSLYLINAVSPAVYIMNTNL